MTNKNLLLTLSLSALILLAGCQNLSNQIAENVIENATGGKAKVDMNTGNVKIQTEDGEINVRADGQNSGSVVITDKDGNVVSKMKSDNQGSVTIQTEGNGYIIRTGDTRPAEVPADMPTLADGKEFTWGGTQNEGSLSYKAVGDFQAACTKQLELLANAGWKVDQTFEMNTEEMVFKKLDNADFTLNVNCMMQDGDAFVGLIKAKKQ